MMIFSLILEDPIFPILMIVKIDCSEHMVSIGVKSFLFLL